MSTLPMPYCDLLLPQAYPHAVDRIDVIETHLSWVICTGEYVYKIKRPVEFGFVDYRSLQDRRRYCELELKLNRRTAPHLYLKVVALVRRDGAMLFMDLTTADHGTDEIIDYAVCMRQFPSHELLENHLRAGEVKRSSIRGLASTLAAFHGACESASAASDHGQVPALREDVRQVVDRDGADWSSIPSGQVVDSLGEWMLAEVDRLASTLERRRQQGMIKECHGDLHAGNLIVEADRIIPFDGIEFSEELRWIDTMNDLAFIYMDLCYWMRDDLASILLNHYLEDSGDYEGVSCLKLFAVYRATVRAKVALLQADSSHDADQQKGKLLQKADRYLSLAQRLSTPLETYLLITNGVSGSGKSSLSRQLTSRLPVVRLRSDLERKRRFHGQMMTAELAAKQLPESQYKEEVTVALYRSLVEQARNLIQAGFPVVLDAAFLRHGQRVMFQELAKTLQVPFAILSLGAPPSELQRRIGARRQRGDLVSDANQQVLVQQLRTQDMLTEEEQPVTVKIGPEEERVESTIARIREVMDRQ